MTLADHYTDSLSFFTQVQTFKHFTSETHLALLQSIMYGCQFFRMLNGYFLNSKEWNTNHKQKTPATKNKNKNWRKKKATRKKKYKLQKKKKRNKLKPHRKSTPTTKAPNTKNKGTITRGKRTTTCNKYTQAQEKQTITAKGQLWDLKWTPSKDASWPQNGQTLPHAGFICMFYKHLFNRSGF